MGNIASIIDLDANLLREIVTDLSPCTIVHPLRSVCRALDEWSRETTNFIKCITWTPNSLMELTRVLDRSNDMVEPFLWPAASLRAEARQQHKRTLAIVRSIDLSKCVNEAVVDGDWKSDPDVRLPLDINALIASCPSLVDLDLGQYAGWFEQSPLWHMLHQLHRLRVADWNKCIELPSGQFITQFELYGSSQIEQRCCWPHFQQLRVLIICPCQCVMEQDMQQIANLPYLESLTLESSFREGDCGPLFDFLESESDRSFFPSLTSLVVSDFCFLFNDDRLGPLSRLALKQLELSWLGDVTIEGVSKLLVPPSLMFTSLSTIGLSHLPINASAVYDMLACMPSVTSVKLNCFVKEIDHADINQSIDHSIHQCSGILKFLDVKHSVLEELIVNHDLTQTERLRIWSSISRCTRLHTLSFFETELPLLDHDDDNSNVTCRLLNLSLKAAWLLPLYRYYEHEPGIDMLSSLRQYHPHLMILNSIVCSNLQTLELGQYGFRLVLPPESRSRRSINQSNNHSTNQLSLPRVRHLKLRQWKYIDSLAFSELALLCPCVKVLDLNEVCDAVDVNQLVHAFPSLTELRCTEVAFSYQSNNQSNNRSNDTTINQLNNQSINQSITHPSWLECLGSNLAQLRCLVLGPIQNHLQMEGIFDLRIEFVRLFEKNDFFSLLTQMQMDHSYMTCFPHNVRELLDRIKQIRPNLVLFYSCDTVRPAYR